MVSGTRIANARHHVIFRQNRSNGCRDIAIFRFSKMAAAAILDFQKSKFLTASTFERPNLCYCAKCHQGRPIRCWDMANFLFFKMAAVLRVGFLKLQFWMFSGIRSANTRHRVKFRENRSNGCADIAILKFSKMASAAILDFQKFKLLTAGTFFDTKSALLS